MTAVDDPFMTACQVMTWLAFGVPLRKEELGSLGLETVDTCTEEKDRRYVVRGTTAEAPGDVSDLDQAEEELRHAVAARKLVAYGVLAGSGPDQCAEPIPISVFMSRENRTGEPAPISSQMMFTWWCTVESEAAPAAYSAVQFETAEVLAIWPTRELVPPELLPRGAPGRPSNMAIIFVEFDRRVAEGLLLPKIKQEADQLHRWFKSQYPSSDAPTAKTIGGRIRERYRKVQPNQPKRVPEIIDEH